MVQTADIGLIGLAVMGQNLVLNMNDHGFTVAVYNRTHARVDEFLQGPAKGSKIIGAQSLDAFFASLKRPRKVMFMVKAGSAVDELINSCLPYLEPGDIIIDGGNSNFEDTNRRTKELQAKGIIFLGVGISGGEEGARHGPSIMPGGNPAGWPEVAPIFQAIAAKVQGAPCCDWVGEDGAGHYVKMIHNGIEYGDMQLIAEVYDLFHRGLGMGAEALAPIFREWNRGVLDSYLIEITSEIFTVMDSDGKPLVDHILDVAQQKGTGKWTVINALDCGMPLTLIAEAVFARNLSALHEARLKAAQFLGTQIRPIEVSREEYTASLEQALYVAKIISYTQGFMLMRLAAKEYGWHLNFGGIALMWRGGCIIRSAFLGKIKEAFDREPDLESLLFSPYFAQAVKNGVPHLRRVLSQAGRSGSPTPCLSTALAFYDGLRSRELPANLTQAQRDFFGAHTYERRDKPRGQFFHTDWLAKNEK